MEIIVIYYEIYHDIMYSSGFIFPNNNKFKYINLLINELLPKKPKKDFVILIQLKKNEIFDNFLLCKKIKSTFTSDVSNLSQIHLNQFQIKYYYINKFFIIQLH